MAECALAKKGWTWICGVMRYDCNVNAIQCDACKRVVCRYHLCVMKWCIDCEKIDCKIHIIHPRVRLPICDECIAYNVQHTIDNKTQFVQDYLDPLDLNNILQCYPGVLTKPCKK